MNLNKLVQQVIGTLTIAQPQSEVEFHIPQPLKSVQCDRAQINELFSNLISNGIKYNDKQSGLKLVVLKEMAIADIISR
ncbi:hypothetical protein N0Y54_04560 [Nostoc punctiforme UO1]|uniref:hypothetical protein n=1 Tax=Nostoc punctiforme TaxID=272131 RepID=UPI0030A4B932